MVAIQQNIVVETGNRRAAYDHIDFLGAPGKTRTSNPQIRSLVLYPIELRAQSGAGV
jgi:hypothetical protein